MTTPVDPTLTPAKAPARRPPALAHISRAIWAMDFDVLQDMQLTALRGESTEGILAGYGQPQAPARQGSVAVVPIRGAISQRASFWDNYFGGTSIEAIREALRAALGSPDVKAVVFDIDSPGGTVAGITEFAAEIRAARGQGKRIVAVSNSFCASAAYWLAAQADEVVASPSSSTGSVGVYVLHQEYSRMLAEAGVGTTIISAGPFKTEGNEFEPLPEEAKAHFQERIDAFYGQFVGDIAKGRNLPSATVKSDFGGGRVLLAGDALAAGMVDAIDTLEGAIRRTERFVSRANGRLVAEDEEPAESAYVPAPFTDRLEMLAADAAELQEHALVRAALRAKEGRPALSETHVALLRSTRDAIDVALAPVEPVAEEPTQPATTPAEPPTADPSPVPARAAAALPPLAEVLTPRADDFYKELIS